MSRFIIKPLKWTWTNSVGTPYDPPVPGHSVPRIVDPDLPRVGEIFIDKLGNVYTHIIDNGVHKYVCMGDDSDYDILTENGEYLKARGTLESYDKILGRATDIKDITSLDELYVAILKTGNTGRVEYKDFNGIVRKSEYSLNFAFNAGSNADRIFMCRTAAGMSFIVRYNSGALKLFVLDTTGESSGSDVPMFAENTEFTALGRRADAILQISEEGVFLVINNGALSIINLHTDINSITSISGDSLAGYSFEHSIPKAVQEFCPAINGFEGKSTTYHAFSGNKVATISYNGSSYSYAIATISNLSRAHSLGINSLVSVAQDQAGQYRVFVDNKQVGINLGGASVGFIDDIDYQAYKKNDEELRKSKTFAIRNSENKWHLVSVHEHLNSTLFSKLFEGATYYSDADFSKIYYLGEGYVASVKNNSILLYNVAFVDDAMHMTAAEMSMSEAQITSDQKELYTSIKPSETVIKNNNSNITETVSGTKASTKVQSNNGNEKVEISADTTQNSSGISVESPTKSYVHVSEKDNAEKASTKIDIEESTNDGHKVSIQSKSENAKTGLDQLVITKNQVTKTDSYDDINSKTETIWSAQNITETSNVTSDIEQRSVISRENSGDKITETKELKRKSSSVIEVSGDGTEYTINETKDIVAATGTDITHTIDMKEHIHTSGANDENNGQFHEVKLESNGADGAGYVTEEIKNTSSNSTITNTVDVEKASEVKTYGTHSNGDKLKTEEKLYKKTSGSSSSYHIIEEKTIAGAGANDTIEVSYDRGNEKETMTLSDKKAYEKLESNSSYIERSVDKTNSSNEKVYEKLYYDSDSYIETKSEVESNVRKNIINNVNGTSSANMTVAKNGDYSLKMDKTTNNHSYIQSSGNNVSVDFQSASGGSATLRVAEYNSDTEDHSIQLDASSSHSRIFAKSDVVSGSGNYQTSFEAKSDANTNTITQSVDNGNGGSIAQTKRTASKTQADDLLKFGSNDYAQTTVQANSVIETHSANGGTNVTTFTNNSTNAKAEFVNTTYGNILIDADNSESKIVLNPTSLSYGYDRAKLYSNAGQSGWSIAYNVNNYQQFYVNQYAFSQYGNFTAGSGTTASYSLSGTEGALSLTYQHSDTINTKLWTTGTGFYNQVTTNVLKSTWNNGSANKNYIGVEREFHSKFDSSSDAYIDISTRSAQGNGTLSNPGLSEASIILFSSGYGTSGNKADPTDTSATGQTNIFAGYTLYGANNSKTNTKVSGGNTTYTRLENTNFASIIEFNSTEKRESGSVISNNYNARFGVQNGKTFYYSKYLYSYPSGSAATEMGYDYSGFAVVYGHEASYYSSYQDESGFYAHSGGGSSQTAVHIGFNNVTHGTLGGQLAKFDSNGNLTTNTNFSGNTETASWSDIIKVANAGASSGLGVACGNNKKFIYIDSNGAFKAHTSSLGASNKPIFIDSSGQFAAVSETIGASSPDLLFMNVGAFKKSTLSVGDALHPAYLSEGTFKKVNTVPQRITLVVDGANHTDYNLYDLDGNLRSHKVQCHPVNFYLDGAPMGSFRLPVYYDMSEIYSKIRSTNERFSYLIGDEEAYFTFMDNVLLGCEIEMVIYGSMGNNKLIIFPGFFYNSIRSSNGNLYFRLRCMSFVDQHVAFAFNDLPLRDRPTDMDYMYVMKWFYVDEEFGLSTSIVFAQYCDFQISYDYGAGAAFAYGEIKLGHSRTTNQFYMQFSGAGPMVYYEHP